MLASWQPIGPNPILNGQVENVLPNNEVAGAVQAVVAHPTDPKVLYVGTTNGGVWMTENATSTSPRWKPLTDSLPSLSIRDLRMDPTNPNQLVASVGRSSSFSREGGERVGLYLTVDGGENWSVLSDPLFAGEDVRAAEIRGNTIILGTTDIETDGTYDNFGGGLYRSADLGNTWTKVDFEFQDPDRVDGFYYKYSVLDLVADTSDTSGAESRFYALIVTTSLIDDFRGIYLTEDGGDTWDNITARARRDPIIDAEFDLLGTIPPPDIQDAILGRIQRQIDSDDAGVGQIVEVPYLDEQPVEQFPGDLTNVKLSVSADGGRLYAMIADAGVVKYIGYTDDQGAQWTAMDLPLISGISTTARDQDDADTGSDDTATSETETDPADPTTLIPGTEDAVYLSLLADPNDRNIVYVGRNQEDTTTLDDFFGANGFSGTIWRGDNTYLPSIGINDEGDGDLPEPVGRELLNAAILLRDDNQVTIVQDNLSKQWSHLTHTDEILMIPAGGTANDSAPHIDSRDMVLDANGELIEVDGGGIYRRTNPLDNTGDWFSLNGNLQITEFHNIAYDNTSQLVLGGAQDVGTPQQEALDDTSWAGVQVFDLVGGQEIDDPFRLNANGGDVAVDDSSKYFSFRYSSSQGAGFIRRQMFDSNNRFLYQTFLELPDGFEAPLVTPIEVNTVAGTQLLVVGENGIYESFDRGDTFDFVTGIANTPSNPGRNAVAYGGFRDGRANAGVIYVGVGNEILIRTRTVVQVTTDDGATDDDGNDVINPNNLELTRAQFPGGDIRDLALDPDDWMTAYVTGQRGIWMTTDAGKSWTDVTGNMTASFVKPIQYIEGPKGQEVHTDYIVLGTNRGVFSMDVSDPGVWRPLSTELPNALVYDLDYDRKDNVLVAGTLGRGAWLLTDASNETESSILSPPVNSPGIAPIDPPVVPLLTGSVSGHVFGDLNEDGVKADGEIGLPGVLVYADQNGDQLIGVLEPKATTNASGDFFIPAVPVGSQIIQVAPTAGFIFEEFQTVTIANSMTTVTTPFAGLLRFDFGDAPDPYPTQIAEGGPSHGRIPGLFLGRDIDGELDGQIDDNASGADEDGVVFVSGLEAGTTTMVTVIANQPPNLHGYLNVWIDFNDDGDWTDPKEQVAVNLRLADGVNSVPIMVPAAATASDTLARFRWSYDKDISFNGSVFGGEVEDYLVSITTQGSSGSMAVDDTFAAVEDQTEPGVLDVTANDIPDIQGRPLSVEIPAGQSLNAMIETDGTQIFYTPNTNFNGIDSFVYDLVDSSGAKSTATVTVNVESRNDPPTARDDNFAVGVNTDQNVLDLTNNDLIAPDENETLSITAVTPTSTGGTVTIGPHGSFVRYTPPVGFHGTDTFAYTISDGNGGSDTATVNLEIDDNLIFFRPQVTTLDGVSLTQPLEFDDEFLLSVFTQDRRSIPTGVFSAYLDVTYDANLVEIAGELDFSNGEYAGATSGSTAIAGLIDEAGGMDGTTPLGGAEFLVFEVPFRVVSKKQATMTIKTDAADLLPVHEVTLFGGFAPVDASLINFQTVDVEIEGRGARSDHFTVLEDTTAHLNVLLNDIATAGSGPLTIDSISELPSAGGSATIIPDPEAPSRMTVEYVPAMDFPWEVSSNSETFKYLARDSAGGLTEATVLITVTNKPDLPTAVDDSRIVEIGSTTRFDLISNDTNFPDPPAELTIVSVMQPTGGGSVSFNTGTSDPVIFIAPTTAGTVSFSYTIMDVDGLTDTAIVTVDVSTGASPLMEFLFEVTDTQGTPIASVTTGEPFLLHVSAQDLREVPRGVFSAYLDVITTGTGTVTGNGPIQFNEAVFPSAQSGTIGTFPLVDELGAVDGISVVDPESAVLLATIPLVATSVGDLTFTGDPADIVPPNEITLFGAFNIVSPDQQGFSSDTVSIVSPASSSNVILDVDKNGNVTPFDALLVINELEGVTPRAASSSSTSPRPSAPARSPYDVNGDGKVTPLDALFIINELDARSPSNVPRSSSNSVIIAKSHSGKNTETISPQQATIASLSTLNSDSHARAATNLIRQIVANSIVEPFTSTDPVETALDYVLAMETNSNTNRRWSNENWHTAGEVSPQEPGVDAFDELFSELDDIKIITLNM